jgi:hypothetical protein
MASSGNLLTAPLSPETNVNIKSFLQLGLRNEDVEMRMK